MVPIKRTSRPRSARPPYRAAPAGLLPVLALLLAGCGGSPDDPGAPLSEAAESDAPASASETDGSPDTSRFDRFDPEVGALDTTLFYCAPGLADSVRDGCDLDRIRSTVTDDVVEPIREEVEASPDPEEYADVSAALDGLDGAVEELGACEDWFGSEEHGSTTECGQAWSSLNSYWRDLTDAVGYGVP
ncbi:hypothetical protein A6A08_14175 [Nocardiopsis sp. TSRI0078]|uniref:hypothetical protein n=1 Tax=unclassified Nocardiopsis TaxID=2649073 RepID=UPI00093923AE|nr:hypothetical protein [Nocardiopsis sp. TSRI0078]OKI13445.1 hypothetical protein A6A08_14175 [Nocardiopsis sp. TSRI0078]